MRYALSDGHIVEAGPKLGEGGEGVVYESRDGRSAIKIYHTPLTGVAAEKLKAMIARDAGQLATQAAWPRALIADASGRIAGFVMQKAEEPFDIHAIYSPRDRREKLPRADWKFLVRAAANLAAAFHTAHAAGIVIGDVNHGSVRVGRDGRVRLIDCDSYQVTDGGKVWRCGVGVDAYTPPELQGVSLRDVDRTMDHDAFGLAVLIFQLLFMGRHPFAGAPVARNAPTDIPAAISARAYAYADAGSLLKPPPSAPPINLVTPDIAALFEQAFAGRGGRPTALAWHQALVAFEQTLAPCAAHTRHRMPAHLGACPWCAFEQAGVDFFPAPLSAGATIDVTRFDPAAFETAWKRVEAASSRLKALAAEANLRPGGADGLPAGVEAQLQLARKSPPKARQLAWAIGWLRRVVAIASVGLAQCMYMFVNTDMAVLALIGGVALQLLSPSLPYVSRDRVLKSHEALRHLCIARAQAISAALRVAPRNDLGPNARRDATQQVREIRALQKQIHEAPRRAQLKAFLEKFPLQKDAVSGIGQSRISQLASFGIESAADIERDAILAVPGFGPQLADRLCQWRDGLKARFRFNPSSPVRSAEIRLLERQLNPQLLAYREALTRTLRMAEVLERRLSGLTQRISGQESAIASAVSQVVGAEANHRAARLIPRPTS